MSSYISMIWCDKITEQEQNSVASLERIIELSKLQ
jgi:hypothetical protein